MNYIKITIGIFLALAASRFIPHPPNFTPIITTAILSTFFFRKLYLSLIVILIAMLLSDIFIGFYKLKGSNYFDYKIKNKQNNN